ncbi:MAG: glycosyltransferase family 2 protein [Acidilobaceae archaeon]|nr:glycosyltransferase family 2 protein [Acidilobaceae archaeon]MCX8165225.1 glycosyltransferase family 2 protein [Acidilobaceae archaeon]MDW7973651.1 glycosyltransferase family 2 protein [Sulfolobales archaeon]
MKLTVVIPTYNEAENVPKLIPALRRALEGIDYELLFVDDDSPDGTWRIVEEEQRKDARVRLLRRVGRRGLGSAIVEGIRAARGEFVVVMDADFQHPPELVPLLLREAERGAEVVVASRYRQGGGVRGWSLARRVISWGASLLAYLLLGEARKTSDPVSGFFLVKRGLNMEGVEGRGYKVLLEILAANPGAKVAEVPYVFSPRAAGRSKLGARDIADYALQVIWLSRPLRFALVGASGVLVNLGSMALLLSLGLPVDLASLTAIELSIAWNFSLHELWTFGSGFSRGVLRRYLGYHASVLAGALTQYLVMRLLYTLLSLNPLLGQLIGVFAGFLLNYALSRSLVWR